MLPLLLLSTLLLLTTSTSPPANFFSSCAEGPTSTLATLLATHDDPYTLLATPTLDGETCLHLTGIEGDLERVNIVTKYILFHERAQTSPPSSLLNAPVATPTGLDMHPISWMIYGGHSAVSMHMLALDEVRVNAVFRNERGEKMTILDVALGLFENVHGEGFDDEKVEHEGDKYFEIVTRIKARGGRVADEVLLGMNAEL